ncbi:MAG: hypothetical protein H0V09_08300, partial [Gemmatimonadetes bacterium]|nr:hypothetical protein [Gemmatimonadota bacterium]
MPSPREYPLTLEVGEVARATGGTLHGVPARGASVTGLTLDSRRVRRGSLFCALPGLEADGISFVPDALARGAAAVLAPGPPPP